MTSRLYADLAPWWPLLSPPEDYAVEARAFLTMLQAATKSPVQSLLELGAGGGHLASQLPLGLEVALLDLPEPMLAQSRTLNPSRTHIQGDMRTVRLERTFDAVLLHDAAMYLTTPQDLRAAVLTAAVHLRPGGAALFVPDLVREDFVEGIVAGGSHGGPTAAKLLEWHWDPDPNDHTFQVEFALLLRESDGTVRCIHDQHTMGMFTRATWFEALRSAGLELHAASPPTGIEVGEALLASAPGNEELRPVRSPSTRTGDV